MKSNDLKHIPCRKFSQGTWHTIQDIVPPEVEVHIHWGDSLRTLWAFPHDMRDLAMGHAGLELCTPQEEPVYVAHEATTFFLKPSPRTVQPRIAPPGPLSAGIIPGTMDHFLGRSGLWEQTGCFHRMAAYNPQTHTFPCFVEDISRHNCVDRLAGWSLRTTRTLLNLILLCSSRVTGSLMKKISKTDFPMVISRSATTQSAIEQAHTAGISLIGFARGQRFTVFCDPKKRILS